MSSEEKQPDELHEETHLTGESTELPTEEVDDEIDMTVVLDGDLDSDTRTVNADTAPRDEDADQDSVDTESGPLGSEAASTEVDSAPLDLDALEESDPGLADLDEVLADPSPVEDADDEPGATQVIEGDFEATESVFEDTESAFEDTESAFDVTESAFEDTESAFEVTESAFEDTKSVGSEETEECESDATVIVDEFDLEDTESQPELTQEMTPGEVEQSDEMFVILPEQVDGDIPIVETEDFGATQMIEDDELPGFIDSTDVTESVDESLLSGSDLALDPTQIVDEHDLEEFAREIDDAETLGAESDFPMEEDGEMVDDDLYVGPRSKARYFVPLAAAAALVLGAYFAFPEYFGGAAEATKGTVAANTNTEDAESSLTTEQVLEVIEEDVETDLAVENDRTSFRSAVRTSVLLGFQVGGQR